MKKGQGVFVVILAASVGMSLGLRPAFGQGLTWAGQGLAQIVEAAQWQWGALRINAALGCRPRS
jgi:hypothetical protein